VTPPEIVAIGSVVLVIGLAAFIGLSNYNAVIALQQRADKAWANIDVALKQRHDMLPNLVAAVRGLMAFEQGVLTAVTQARAAYSPTDPIPSQAATSDQTTAAVRSLFAVVERYPDIKSGANVMELQAEIERIEGIIADRRELYNDQVYRYNTKISTVPAIVLAWLFRWLRREFFEADPADTERPGVELTPTS
jgi:LemA protein